MDKDLVSLYREVMKYERDPKHTITQKHIDLRMNCVIKFGSQAVREVVASVCKELLEARLCSFAHARRSLSQEVVKVKKSSSERAKPVRNKKTSTTSRMGHQIQHGRR